jgi:putative restriction endonuclease
LAIVTDFDAPIYKVLANNDTGAAPGHQGGFVLPKDLEDYFPLLRNETSVLKPTVDIDITADLFDGSVYVGEVETRYQYQTWGGVRSPERRITRNLSMLLNRARGGDILIIERGIDVESHYRFRLITSGNPLHSKLMLSFGSVRWGPLDPSSLPVKETEVNEASSEIRAAEVAPFAMFDTTAAITETRARRIARSRAFQRVVSEAYGGTCAFSGRGLTHPNGRNETEAAHIVSRSLKGSDDVRNGILLSRGFHWAFDRGLVGISEEFKVQVPAIVRDIPINDELRRLHGKAINLPANPDQWPAPEALAWHRANVVISH